LGAASLAVGQAMENLASNKEAFDWLAVVDARSATYANVNTLQTEHLEYTSALGHIAFYAPYVIDLEGQQVPPSPAVVAIACRRNRTQGFQNPPAGVRFALKGVTDVTQKFTNQQLDVLNPTGCNIVSKMREGVVIFAARTRASLPEYRFVNARVIMSVLNGTLRNAFTSELFSVIDGRAALLNRLNESARSVCRRFWLGNALFGETEEEAFQVVCDFSNNLPEDLDEGNVTLEVYASVVPTFEKLLIRTFKVNIGQVQTAAQENN
jgi:phage tail sheath protein FI